MSIVNEFWKRTAAPPSEVAEELDMEYAPATEQPEEPSQPQTHYHTTTALSSVLSEGLKSRDELGQSGGAGLGGGASDVVSVTTDLEIAKSIVDALNLNRKLQQGELGPLEMIEKAEEMGFGDMYLEWVGYVFGVKDKEKARYFLEKLAERKVLRRGMSELPKRTGRPFDAMHEDELEEYGAELYPGNKPMENDFGSWHFAVMAPMDDENYERTLSSTVNYWLGAMQESGAGYNPLFAFQEEGALKNVTEDEIGIIAVQLKPGAQTQDMGAMEELRVPSEQMTVIGVVPYQSRF